jgi:hypothetical protein
MDLLRRELRRRIEALPDAVEVLAAIARDKAPHPCSSHDLMVAILVERGALRVREYLEMREAHARACPNLHLYQITAPRAFGDGWGQAHLEEIAPSLVRPTRELDPGFAGQYDRIHRDAGVRVELKATRVVEDVPGNLPDKALASDTNVPYMLHFKQLKPGCCDAFVLIAVYLDRIRYWVVPAGAMAASPCYNDRLHRNGAGSGQVQLPSRNLALLAPYEVPSAGVDAAVREISRSAPGCASVTC